MNKPIHPAVAEHVMEENARLREALQWIADYAFGDNGNEAAQRARAALSQQVEPACQTMQRPKAECGCPDCGSSLIDWPTAEPTDTFTAVDMATAAAQGFRDGQAAVEPAPAQDEREAFEVEIPSIVATFDGLYLIPVATLTSGEHLMTVAQHLRIEKQLRAAFARPAQTEQQPVAWGAFHFGGRRSGRLYTHCETEQQIESYIADLHRSNDSITLRKGPLYAAPIAQPAPQPEQSGLVEALKRIWRLMADREAQALDGSQDRQLFVTILNIAGAALSPSILAAYSCDYAGCSSKAHPGTSLCLAHHSPKDRAALSAQGTSK